MVQCLLQYFIDKLVSWAYLDTANIVSKKTFRSTFIHDIHSENFMLVNNICLFPTYL